MAGYLDNALLCKDVRWPHLKGTAVIISYPDSHIFQPVFTLLLWPEAFFPCLFFLAKSYAVFKLQAKDTILPETLPESWDGGSDSSECTRASRADLRCTAAACLPLASPSTMSSCEQRCLPDTSVASVQGSRHLNEPLSDPPGRLYNLFSHSPSSPSYCPLTHHLSTRHLLRESLPHSYIWSYRQNRTATQEALITICGCTWIR